MFKTNKRLSILLGIFALPIMMFSSCLKEGDDTIVLPLPDGKIPYSVIPKNLQDSLVAHGFVIHEGIEAPNIEGKFLSSPMVLQYASDNYQNDFYDLYMRYAGQTRRGLIQYSESQRDTVVGISQEANVIGSDSNFTMYCYQTISANNSRGDTLYRCKTASVVSGIITESGIKDCQYSYVMLDKWARNDYYYSMIPEANTYRIWNDGDSLAIRLSE